MLGLAHITANKNTCPGDKSALVPGGLRLGTPALTSRGFNQDDFRKIARFIDEGVELALAARLKAGKTIKKFKEFIKEDPATYGKITELGERVGDFAKKFDFPGGRGPI